MLRRMLPTVRCLFIVFLSAITIPPSAVLAQDEAEALSRAIKLFGQGDYLGAQEALTAIDRAKLNPQQQAQRDDYLNRTQVAGTMAEKARRDLEEAESAVTAGDRSRADRSIAAVLANEYASPEAKKRANELKSSFAAPATAATPTTSVSQEPQPKQEPPAAAPASVKPGNGSEKARTLTRQGDETLRAADYDSAERFYREALTHIAGYPEAVEGLKQVDQHRQNVAGAGPESLIQRIKQEDLINWQRTMAEYRDVEKTIRDHVSGQRFDEANQMLVRARQIVESGKQFADPVSKFESLNNELEALATWVTEQERDFNERKVAEIQRDIEEQRAARLRQDQENRKRQIDALMEQARQHQKEGDLDSAIMVLRQVRVIDPKYVQAQWMMDDFEDMRAFRQARKNRDDLYRQQQGALEDVEESKIPWFEEIRYPKDWLELSNRPERVSPGVARQNVTIISALDQPVPVDFREEPLDRAIEKLADTRRLNVIVNWNDLAREGVDRNVKIDLALPKEISLKRALTEVLDQAGAGRVQLGYEVSEGVVNVATRETLDKVTYQAVYDINDLLQEIPNFTDAPVTELSQAKGGAGTAKADAPVMPWSASEDDNDDSDGANNPERSRRVRELIEKLQDLVAPDSWRDRGGAVGTIKEINGQLVVTQNSAAQRQIESLLGKLREQRAIQIAVEARFITVSSHYLEELGVDLDIVLNSGNAGFDYVPGPNGPVTDPVFGNPLLLPRSFSRLGFTPNTPGLGTALAPVNATVNQPYDRPFFVPQQQGGSGSQSTPVPIINRISSYTDPANLGSDVPGSFAGQSLPPALTIFGSFLDNIQVDLLVRATQADSRTSVLTAPRLVLFNGQRSWVAVTIQQGYVSQLDPTVNTGAVAVAPQTDVINSGAVLDVNATVTADKRYVTMTLRPGVTRLLDLQTIPFSGGAAGGGFGGGTALPAFIQLPTVSAQRLQTTVSVPDGGTLLIGGQKLASETEVEAGVPILSKIPILKRAYSSRSMVKDEQTLLILVKPKILIQSEQEELAFPSFSNR